MKNNDTTNNRQQVRFTRKDIEELYRTEAARHGSGPGCTIQDTRTRNLEYAAISKYIRDGMRVLEVGCGNGFVAERLSGEFRIDLLATDFSEDMINVAQQRNPGLVNGSLKFERLDVLDLNMLGQFDIVFTERCLQNLISWEEQVRSLQNISNSLVPGGKFVMLESFMSGYTNLNEARAELGLDPIAVSWHNLYFDERETIELLKTYGMKYEEENCFLSGYYFGSRVLLPALLPPQKPVSSSSRLNDYFCSLPPAGDFCPMKILTFIKD